MERLLPIALGFVIAQALFLAWAPGDWATFLLYSGSFLLAAVWTALQIFRPQPVFLRWPMLAPLIPAAIGILQIVFHQTAYSWGTWKSVLGWFADTAILFVAVQCFHQDRTRTRWLLWFAYLGFALCALCVAQLYTADGLVLWRYKTIREGWIMGNLSYKNHYAAFAELLFPVLVWLATRSRRPFVYIIMAALVAASSVSALSRAGVVLVVLEFVVCAVILSRRRMVSSRSLMAAVGAFVVVVALGVGAFGFNDFAQKLENNDDRRVPIYQSSLEMFRDRPLTGFGMGTWTTVYPAYAHYDAGLFVNAAHNDWLQWLGDGGVLALAAMLWFAVALFRPALQSLWGLGVIALLLHALVDFPFQLPALSALFFVISGALIASMLETRNAARIHAV